MAILRNTTLGQEKQSGPIKCPSGLGGGFSNERVLGDPDQLAKSSGVLCGEIGQHLAIERHLCGLQSFHESAVSEAGGAGGGIDADLPQRPEIAFFRFAIAIGVLAAMIE